MIMAAPTFVKGQPFTSGPVFDAMKFAAVPQAQVQTPPLAGSYSFNTDKAQRVKELLGDEYGGLIAGAMLLDEMRAEQQSPERIKEQLEVLGPYFKDVAKENQRLGMEANVFKSLLDAPKEFQRAMAEKYRFFGDQLDILAQNTQPASYTTRQYINL